MTTNYEFDELNTPEHHLDDWPSKPRKEADSGILGAYVKRIEDQTKADPFGILTQALVAAGNIIGPRPFMRVGADLHRTNLFAVNVGKTSHARKTMSKNVALAPFKGIDQEWETDCIKNGVSTGEGIVNAVRDPTGSERPIDRRLLLIEMEFGKTLTVMNRNESTTGAILRQAWDGGSQQVLTRTNPLVASNAHISLIGHITRAVFLQTNLKSVDLRNGVANRINWTLVQRARILPEPPPIDGALIEDVSQTLRDAIMFARDQTEMTRDEEARALWNEVYPQLTADRSGVWGDVTARAEAQVLRLSMILALLDRSTVIRVEHLQSALALWNTTRTAPASSLGVSPADRITTKICVALTRSPGGLTRTRVNKNVLGGNLTATEIEDALLQLELDNMITRYATVARVAASASFQLRKNRSTATRNTPCRSSQENDSNAVENGGGFARHRSPLVAMLLANCLKPHVTATVGIILDLAI